jgi:hypothetical protein
MRDKYWLLKLAIVLLCGAMFLGSAFGDDGFYVIGVGSPWKRNGNNIYYTAGNVGIGMDAPAFPLTVRGNASVEIYGLNTANSGPVVGVSGTTQSPSASSYGVYGGASGDATGVRGNANGAGYGVHGFNNSASGYGVYGVNLATGGCAIRGNGSNIGIYGTTNALNGKGVLGETNTQGSFGVYGTNSYAGGIGIEGYSSAISGNGIGVVGLSVSPSGYGVYGQNSQGGYGVYCSGNFAVTGAKNAIVATSQGYRKLYSQESPEVWFEDYGEGQLMGGTARIDLDPLFLETVTINEQNPMKVFIQLNDDCNGVYVQRQATSFQVRELAGGKSKAHFTYRVVAKRKGYETARLEAAADPAAYAALRTEEK